MGKKRKVGNLSTLLEFKRKIQPALSKEDYLDLFFDKEKRQRIYKRFDEKVLEPKEDDFVQLMKNRNKLDE